MECIRRRSEDISKFPSDCPFSASFIRPKKRIKRFHSGREFSPSVFHNEGQSDFRSRGASNGASDGACESGNTSSNACTNGSFAHAGNGLGNGSASFVPKRSHSQMNAVQMNLEPMEQRKRARFENSSTLLDNAAHNVDNPRASRENRSSTNLRRSSLTFDETLRRLNPSSHDCEVLCAESNSH